MTAASSWSMTTRPFTKISAPILSPAQNTAAEVDAIAAALFDQAPTKAETSFEVDSITDTGVGLTAQQLEWIQIPFAQVDGGLAHRNTGLGLGLPLARRLAQAMGGNLTLSGQPHQGAVARFTVKAQPLPAATVAAAA